ncbi:MAG: Ig-like domain-containing protein [Gemmatimonadales bacterium]|nr:Ig-like domain-containing protein [Gemmatimonadales bacterium]
MRLWPTSTGRRVALNLTALAVVSLGAAACSSDSESFTGPIEYVDVRPLVIGTVTTNLPRGITVQLRAVPVNADENWVQQAVTWSSSDDGKATVDQTGLVTTRGGGDVTISASSGGKTGSFDLNIQYPVGTVTITGNVASIRKEGAVQLTANVNGTDGQPAIGRSVSWSSSNQAVATVSQTGFVAGLTNGTTTITATSEGVSGSVIVTVQGEPVVNNVTVTPGTPFLGVGMTQQFTQTPRAGSGTIITGTVPVWSSSNAAVATVNPATGFVTVVGAGKTTISAVVDNGLGANVTGSTELEAAPLLAKGVQVAVPTLAAGSGFALYAYNVPAGATSFNVTTTGGTGDADVYLFRPGLVPATFNGNAFPAWANYTGLSGNSGNSENRTETANLPGVWRVYTHAWAGGGTVTGLLLTATHTP